MTDTPKRAFDCAAVVQTHVQRACQSPFYSYLREEVTRQINAVDESRIKTGTSPGPTIGIADGPDSLIYFPFQNGRSSEESRIAAAVTPERVVLIGATGFFGKFVAEQYLSRGISVTVLARDMEKAKAIFLPIASGEREERTSASKGFVRLPGHAKTHLTESNWLETESGPRKAVRYQFTSSVSTPTSSEASPSVDKTAAPSARTSLYRRDVVLELVEGDVNSQEDVEFAVRQAALVYYLAPATAAPPDEAARRWNRLRSFFGSPVEAEDGSGYSGFVRAFDACRRVDAHFVSLTPLWVHGSRLSPLYWYRRMVTHPWGYVKAVRSQEQNMLGSGGIPSPRCYFGTEAGADALEPLPMWKYWWSILRSTKLPDDVAYVPRSSVRFSLFRAADITYPAFNTNMAAAKNNRIDDALHKQHVESGDLDARNLASVLAKTLALCTSVVDGRIDVGGRLRGGTDMRDSAAVLELFSHFRSEE